MSYVLSDGNVRITGHSGVVTELPGDALRWESPFEDADTGELVHLATIAAEEFQGSADDLVVLKVTETESGGIQGGEVMIDRNDGDYEVDTEDLTVTIDDDLDIGETDD
jgi:hypothetical protein